MQRIAILLAAVLAGPAAAANDPHAGHSNHAMPAKASAPAVLADGVVKKVDPSSAMVTLAHGPLPNGMGAMTMAFKVKNPTLLAKLKEGQKIRFAIDEAMNITHIE